MHNTQAPSVARARPGFGPHPVHTILSYASVRTRLMHTCTCLICIFGTSSTAMITQAPAWPIVIHCHAPIAAEVAPLPVATGTG